MIISFNFDNSTKKRDFIIKSKVLGKDFFIGCDSPFYLIKNKRDSIILEGDLYYFYDDKQTEYLSNKSKKFIINFLSRIIREKSFDYCRRHLEGVYTSLIFNNNFFCLQADRLKRREIFYFCDKTKFFAASELFELTSRMPKLEYDQNTLASILATHYQYSPAKHTIYKNIHALSADEYIKYSEGKFFGGVNSKFQNIENYNNDKLKEYEEILNRAILSRSDNSLNIVNSTGGWDSTYLIVALTELIGKNKVIGVTFNHILKNGMSWNRYEKTRAKKIAERLGIKHIEAVIDFRSPSLVDYLNELSPVLRARNVYIGALPHFLLYKTIKNRLLSSSRRGAGTVFTGEACDSVHNFGFSQYVSFFHESYPFKEYGDKMKNYLYSPVFFEKVKSNIYKDDMVFKIWKDIAKNTEDCTYCSNKRRDVLFKYLSPILFGQSRIPFERILTTENLTKFGRGNLINLIRNQYFTDVINNINSRNYYSCLFHLYKRFHLQGPTMKMIPIAANYNGFRAVIPFLDMNLIRFLEKMPASWGRGLELNNTKYPLKAIAMKNKNFPIDIITSGIRCYPSEADPTLKDETYNFYFNSTATNYFKEILRARKYKEVLSGKHFNFNFIDKQVSNFLNNKMEKVEDYYSLIRLINFVSIGWY